MATATTPAVVYPPLPVAVGTAPAMVSIEDMAKKKGIVILIHGASGVGKTSLIRTLPMERTFVIDIDGGVLGLSDAGKPGTPYEHLPSWGKGNAVQIDETFSNLKQTVDWLTTANPPMTKQGNPITTVVLDSVSLMEKRMIFFYAGTGNVHIQHYGDAAVSARRCILALRDLCAKGINVVYMCHSRADIKGLEGVVYPSLSDKLAPEIVALCDAIGYMEIAPDQVTRTLRFCPTANIIAKSRFNQIRDFEVLDLGDLIGRVLGARRLPPAPVVVPPSVPVKVEAPKPETTKEKK